MAANRRTISRAIVSSMKFLSMSKQAQALYMHIVINSDDDGICEAGVVLRATNTRKTALNELIDNGYVALIEPTLNIVWTVDWRSFVTVDARYGQPSRYRETMLEHFPCYEFVDFKGNNGNSHASGTRTSEVKSSEEKRSEVKSSQVKEPEPVPSNDKLTELTTFSVNEKPSTDISTMFFWSKGYSPDDARAIGEKFIRLNNGWGWKCLNGDGWMIAANTFADRERDWTPEKPDSIQRMFSQYFYGDMTSPVNKFFGISGFGFDVVMQLIESGKDECKNNPFSDGYSDTDFIRDVSENLERYHDFEGIKRAYEKNYTEMTDEQKYDALVEKLIAEGLWVTDIPELLSKKYGYFDKGVAYEYIHSRLQNGHTFSDIRNALMEHVYSDDEEDNLPFQ